VVAWAALAAVSDHCAYASVAENSIYGAERALGLGVGRRLLTELVERDERAGISPVQTGIFPENPPAWSCTAAAVSQSWACASESASSTAAGGR
jgi:L-amino acid N-acyltransferase YncA